MRKLVSNKMVNEENYMEKTERCLVASKAVGQMKRVLRQQAFGHFADLHLLDITLNEAESAAWETTFPHLFFPVLAEEKITQARLWAERQRTLKASTSELCFAA